jgi:hypothetical protein
MLSPAMVTSFDQQNPLVMTIPADAGKKPEHQTAFRQGSRGKTAEAVPTPYNEFVPRNP